MANRFFMTQTSVPVGTKPTLTKLFFPDYRGAIRSKDFSDSDSSFIWITAGKMKAFPLRETNVRKIIPLWRAEHTKCLVPRAQGTSVPWELKCCSGTLTSLLKFTPSIQRSGTIRVLKSHRRFTQACRTQHRAEFYPCCTWRVKTKARFPLEYIWSALH